MKHHQYEVIVIGSSAGGLLALKNIISHATENCIPIIVVQHIRDDVESNLVEYLATSLRVVVKEAEQNEVISLGTVYVAPPGYHLLVEPDKTLSLSVDERVNFSRPSIDVLFESAAYAYKDKLIGILLSGANTDGSLGMAEIKKHGGLKIVQDPGTTSSPYMPEAAIRLDVVDHIFRPDEITNFLSKHVSAI